MKRKKFLHKTKKKKRNCIRIIPDKNDPVSFNRFYFLEKLFFGKHNWSRILREYQSENVTKTNTGIISDNIKSQISSE